MALYDGLVEYHPKTLRPIPALAERWDVNNDSSEFVFHLRQTGRWSNGDPIGANDFVYSIRRALSPELASRNAYLAYYIKYAQAYNEGAVFVRNAQTGQFLLARDFEQGDATAPLSAKPVDPKHGEYQPTAEEPKPDPDTAFHQFMHSSARLTLPGSEKARNKFLADYPNVKAALAGTQFVKVAAEDVRV